MANGAPLKPGLKDSKFADSLSVSECETDVEVTLAGCDCMAVLNEHCPKSSMADPDCTE